MFSVELEHGRQVDGADYVDVVEKEGLVGEDGVISAGVGAARIFLEKPGGFFQAPAGVQELIVFAGDFDAHVEIVFGFEILLDHVGEVVDVDDGFGDAEGAEAGEEDFEESAVVDFDQGFGARVGQGAEAGA